LVAKTLLLNPTYEDPTSNKCIQIEHDKSFISLVWPNFVQNIPSTFKDFIF